MTDQDATASGGEQHSAIESVLIKEPRRTTLANVLEGVVAVPEDGSRIKPWHEFCKLTDSQQAVALCLGQHAVWRLRKDRDQLPRSNALTIGYLNSQTTLAEPQIRDHELLDTTIGSQSVTVDINQLGRCIDYLRRRNCADANDERTLEEKINDEMVVSREGDNGE